MLDPRKILLIEDESVVRIGLIDNLAYEGFDVLSASDGIEGMEVFEREHPDLVILDIMMPGLDGIEVCRRIRAAKNNVPIIMLTAKCSEIDKVVGLEMGADDYLTKPFAMRELFARVRALFRRYDTFNSIVRDGEEQKPLEILQFSDVVIDFKTYRASKGGAELSFSAKEFELLKYLACRRDQPISRDELLDKVWGYENYPTTRTVDNFIARLRKQVEDFPEKPQHILTVHGVGYKFLAN